MKKLLATTALVAALVAGAQSAMADPVLTLSVYQANGTAAQCNAMAALGSLVLADGTGAVQSAATWNAGTCTVTSSQGGVDLQGKYGDFAVTANDGTSAPIYPEPKFWVDAAGTTTVAGAVLGVSLVVNDYSTPTGTFGLLSTASGVIDVGMNTKVDTYFDAANGDTAGVGTHLLNADWGDGSLGAGAVPLNVTNVTVAPDTLYTLSWTDIITDNLSNGVVGTSGIRGQLGQNVPTPAPLSLLGFGLVALAFVSRRRGFQN